MKVILYKSGVVRPGYRWKFVAENGKNMANGGQRYSRRIDMLASLEKVTCGAILARDGALYLMRGYDPTLNTYAERIPIYDETGFVASL